VVTALESAATALHRGRVIERLDGRFWLSRALESATLHRGWVVPSWVHALPVSRRWKAPHFIKARTSTKVPTGPESRRGAAQRRFHRGSGSPWVGIEPLMSWRWKAQHFIEACTGALTPRPSPGRGAR